MYSLKVMAPTALEVQYRYAEQDDKSMIRFHIS